MRLYLSGRTAIEGEGALLDQRALGGRQGRLALAYLTLERRPVPREELAAVLWPGEIPESWDAALSAVVSKLRTALRKVGLAASGIRSELGCYELILPVPTWVDVNEAIDSLHAAEAADRSGSWRDIWGTAGVAYQITQRVFLPGEEGPWVERQRRLLGSIHLRATEFMAQVSLRNGEPAIAIALAEELLAVEPFRETGYQILMRAHMQLGNRAEALQAYERCKRLLAEELGADPSPETQSVHLELLTTR